MGAAPMWETRRSLWLPALDWLSLGPGFLENRAQGKTYLFCVTIPEVRGRRLVRQGRRGSKRRACISCPGTPRQLLDHIEGFRTGCTVLQNNACGRDAGQGDRQTGSSFCGLLASSASTGVGQRSSLAYRNPLWTDYTLT